MGTSSRSARFRKGGNNRLHVIDQALRGRGRFPVRRILLAAPLYSPWTDKSPPYS